MSIPFKVLGKEDTINELTFKKIKIFKTDPDTTDANFENEYEWRKTDNTVSLENFRVGFESDSLTFILFNGVGSKFKDENGNPVNKDGSIIFSNKNMFTDNVYVGRHLSKQYVFYIDMKMVSTTKQQLSFVLETEAGEYLGEFLTDQTDTGIQFTESELKRLNGDDIIAKAYLCFKTNELLIMDISTNEFLSDKYADLESFKSECK